MGLKDSTIVEKLRLAGLVEGGSFVILLFLAMPLKYLFGYPQAVSVVGMAHGVLFLIYLLLLIGAQQAAGWTWGRAAFLLGAALIPFGPFLIDAKMREYQEAYKVS